MAAYVVLILSLLLSQFGFGQQTKLKVVPYKPPTKKEIQTEQNNHHCVKRKNDQFNIRIKNYPFSMATQIQLVSFKSDYKNEDSLPRINDTICYSKLMEIKSITFSQVDKLTDIFFNYGYRGPVHLGSLASCYNPRNAILFLDDKGKVFEYIEICFECNETKKSSEKISLGQMCDEKMGMLKDFFKTVGVEYGITKVTGPDD